MIYILIFCVKKSCGLFLLRLILVNVTIDCGDVIYEHTIYTIFLNVYCSHGEGLGGRVGEKRKKADDLVAMMVSEEGSDEEAKLLRTVLGEFAIEG